MIAPNDMNPATLAAANARLRKSRSGSMGDTARRSQTTNPVSNASPAASPSNPGRSPRPDPPTRPSPQMGRAGPTATSTAPGTSIRPEAGFEAAAAPVDA